MIQAIALSDNIYALKTLLLLGSENLVELLSSFNINNVESLPSIALGTVNTSLLKLTSLYNTFASLGSYHQPSFINKVTDFYDNTLYLSSSLIYVYTDFDPLKYSLYVPFLIAEIVFLYSIAFL